MPFLFSKFTGKSPLLISQTELDRVRVCFCVLSRVGSQSCVLSPSCQHGLNISRTPQQSEGSCFLSGLPPRATAPLGLPPPRPSSTLSWHLRGQVLPWPPLPGPSHSDPAPGGKIERLSPTGARPLRPGLTGGPAWGIGDFHQVPHPGGRRAVRLPEDSEGQAGLLGVGRGYWGLSSAYICLFIVFNKMALTA